MTVGWSGGDVFSDMRVIWWNFFCRFSHSQEYPVLWLCAGAFLYTALLFYFFSCSYSTGCPWVCPPLHPWPELIVSHCHSFSSPSSFISNYLLPLSSLLVFLCDLLRGAGRQQRNLPVWNDLSSQHYQPNTPPSILCYKGLGKLLFLWDMIKEMLPYVHIFYCPMLERDTPWFTILETSLCSVWRACACVAGWLGWKRRRRTWILL